MTWLRERIEKDDLFDVLKASTYSEWGGFGVVDIPGLREFK